VPQASRLTTIVSPDGKTDADLLTSFGCKCELHLRWRNSHARCYSRHVKCILCKVKLIFCWAKNTLFVTLRKQVLRILTSPLLVRQTLRVRFQVPQRMPLAMAGTGFLQHSHRQLQRVSHSIFSFGFTNSSTTGTVFLHLGRTIS
jgi:hypothetical protein